jgi:predicted secreted Zn-dependent protease
MIVRIALPILLVIIGCVATSAGPPPIVVPVLPPTLPQGIVLDAHRTMYRVFGRDLTSLTASMRASGVFIGGKHWQGLHQGSVRWNYRTRKDSLQCAVHSVTVTIESEVTLPSWDPPVSARRELRAEWRDYLAALETHEVGHQSLYVAGGIRLRDGLLAVRALRCEQIAPLVAAEGHRLRGITNAEQARYDVETDHGRSQGVEWPPPLGRAR